jgi:shikimate kinase/3-dehydroquinate synthase
MVVNGGAGDLAATVAAQVNGRNALLVVDRGFWSHHRREVAGPMRAAGLSTLRQVVGGERIKTWRTAGALATWMIESRLDRSSVVVSMGGGATSDLVGFAASVTLRGVPVIHVPTTLLAMADASLGGKTGVNLPSAKNMLGTFHHPEAVIAWPDALKTLDARTYRSGLAEVVKSAALSGEDELSALEASVSGLLGRHREALLGALTTSLSLKARIVSRDPQEKAERALLNLGHTFGHTWEKQAQLNLDHGEAVAAGIVTEARMGADFGITPPQLVTRLERLLCALGFDTSARSLPVQTWSNGLVSDKKRVGNSVTMAFLRGPGHGVLQKILVSDLIEWLESSRLLIPPNRS